MNDIIALSIREILLSQWDPLNVGENENLHDEYDDVIRTILDDKITNPDAILQVLRLQEMSYGIDATDTAILDKVALEVSRCVSKSSKN